MVSICFGQQYWDLFSEQFFATTGSVEPRPAKIVLVTDVPRETPEWIESHAIGEGLPLYAYYRAAVDYVDTEWVWGVGFDDLIEPAAFEPFDCDADCLVFPAKMMGEGLPPGAMCSYHTGPQGYETMYEGGPNPMLGSFWHRASVLREIPWRDHDFGDWTHWAEMSYFGKTLAHSDRVVATWLRREGSASLRWNPDGINAVWAFQEALRSGRVPYPGAEVTDEVVAPIVG